LKINSALHNPSPIYYVTQLNLAALVGIMSFVSPLFTGQHGTKKKKKKKKNIMERQQASISNFFLGDLYSNCIRCLRVCIMIVLN
jgi:hypothetical protein